MPTSISSEQQILQFWSFTILDGSTIEHNSSQVVVGQTVEESQGDNNQEARPGAYGRFGRTDALGAGTRAPPLVHKIDICVST